MHYRRLACLLLGAWLAGSVFMTMVATQNFRAVDRLLAGPSPAAAQAIQTLGQPTARAFLRYQVSELNRLYFTIWEFVQLALGVLLLYALLISRTSGRTSVILAAIMLAAVIAMRFYMTPEIVRLGRVVESLGPGEGSLQRAEFWKFHITYSVTELAKLLLGVILAFRLIWRTSHDRAEKIA